MSKNLLKSYAVVQEQDTCLINTNSLVEEKLEKIRDTLPKEALYAAEDSSFYTEGLGAQTADIASADAIQKIVLNDMDAAQEAGDEQNQDITPVSNVIKAAPKEPVYEGPTPEELIKQAEAEIGQMKQQAQEEIERQREQALHEASESGYEKGMEKARAEAAGLRESLENEKKRLEDAYEEKVRELEPKFIRVLTDVYERVFHVDFAKDEGLIVSMVKNSMEKIDGSRNFLIHVSREDYEKVSGKREELLSQTNAGDVTVDIIEDATLLANDCMIETENGIFDCGIGTQLEELKNRLMLLSYDGK